jgi:carboxymethylenebutenolidase
VNGDTATERCRFNVPDGSFDALLFRPASSPAPGLLILPEVFGRSVQIRAVAAEFAGHGFLAGALDLHWRLEPEVALRPDEIERARDLHLRLDYAAAVHDIGAAVEQFRAAPGCSGKVGLMGFCLGGTLAWIAAARTGADACVGYYGTRLPRYLGETANLRHPVMLHIGEADRFTPADVIRQIEDTTRNHPLVERFRYPGAGHAFCNPSQEHFDAQSCAAAHRRSLAFLGKHLS